jgi:hypothetical protein
MSQEVTNRNFLSPLGFKLLLKRAPGVEFFVQSVKVPGLSLNSVETPNPFVSLPYGGDHISYEEFEVSFRVDEDMKSWMEIYTWIRDTGFPENYGQYESIAKGSKIEGLGLKSDIVLTILNSAMRPNIELTFRDAMPISITGFDMNSMDSSVNYISSTARFRYTYFNITTNNN